MPATWHSPRTWSTNDLVSSTHMNEELRDNLLALATMVPPGVIVPYAGTNTAPNALPTDTTPRGWLFCNGQSVSRTAYAALFAIIGTTYGSDNGSTFKVPDLRGRFPLGKDNMGPAGSPSADRVLATQADNLGQGAGAETHTLTVPELPAHSHTVPTVHGTNNGSLSGLAHTTNKSDVADEVSSNTGSGQAHNNMPPYLTVNYLIKT